MNILIIGGAGFIGSHLAKKLIKLGHRVTVVDSNVSQARQIFSKNISFYDCDFGTQLSMKKILKTEHIDLVIQCAGNSSIDKSMTDPLNCYINNVMGNIFLINAVLDESINKFIYISSYAVFGNCENMPINDSSIRSPICPIGDSQLFVENMLESLRVSRNLSYVVVRRSEVVGLSEIENEFFIKNIRNGLIGDIIKFFLGEISVVKVPGMTHATVDRSMERDYVHIDDFCDACINTLPKLGMKEERMAYNIGSGRKYSVKEVISIAEKVLGIQIKTCEGDAVDWEPSRAYFDVCKSQLDLDWRPKYGSLDEIFKTILPYYSGRQR